MNIGILGAGSWAIALSALLGKKGHSLSLWEFNADDCCMLQEKREHPLKLPGIKVPQSAKITNAISEVVDFSEIIVCAVPAQTMRSTMKRIVAECTPETINRAQAWVIVSKGIECGTGRLMSDVLLDELSEVTKDKIVVVSGPSLADEVSRGVPTTVVAASTNIELADKVQLEFSTDTFRIYTNTDLIGVELAGSIKNVIAVAAGICDGLGLGDNTKGALLTRGLVEITRLGEKMGGRFETFSGLAGVGDLITTCISRHSRNRAFGELIGKGFTHDEALKKMIMVAEGVETTRSTHQLAQKMGVEMPITHQVYLALFEGKPAKLAIRELMARQSRPER